MKSMMVSTVANRIRRLIGDDNDLAVGSNELMNPQRFDDSMIIDAINYAVKQYSMTTRSTFSFSYGNMTADGIRKIPFDNMLLIGSYVSDVRDDMAVTATIVTPPTRLYIVSGNSFTFTGTVTANYETTTLEREWLFSDNDSYVTESVTKAFNTIGSYQVTLTGRDSYYGFSDSDSRDIEVIQNPDITIDYPPDNLDNPTDPNNPDNPFPAKKGLLIMIDDVADSFDKENIYYIKKDKTYTDIKDPRYKIYKWMPFSGTDEYVCDSPLNPYRNVDIPSPYPIEYGYHVAGGPYPVGVMLHFAVTEDYIWCMFQNQRTQTIGGPAHAYDTLDIFCRNKNLETDWTHIGECYYKYWDYGWFVESDNFHIESARNNTIFIQSACRRNGNGYVSYRNYWTAKTTGITSLSYTVIFDEINYDKDGLLNASRSGISSFSNSSQPDAMYGKLIVPNSQEIYTLTQLFGVDNAIAGSVFCGLDSIYNAYDVGNVEAKRHVAIIENNELKMYRSRRNAQPCDIATYQVNSIQLPLVPTRLRTLIRLTETLPSGVNALWYSTPFTKAETDNGIVVEEKLGSNDGSMTVIKYDEDVAYSPTHRIVPLDYDCLLFSRNQYTQGFREI